MKRFLVFIVVIITAFSAAVSAQGGKDIATEQFKVAGNCDMCKQRIEEAAYGKGVKSAVWDKSTGMLTVVYRPSKIAGAEIRQRIAAAGHDADTIRASEDAYHKLPECCSYRTSPCNH